MSLFTIIINTRTLDRGMKVFLARCKELLSLIFSKYPDMKVSIDYDHYWDEKRDVNLGSLTDFQQRRVDIIAKNITKKGSIKDVGCGDGGLLVALSSKVDFSTVTAADISPKVLKHLKKHDVKTEKVDLRELSSVTSLSKTDYTIILEVLEHLPNSEEVLLELLKTTKNTLFFSVPNTGYIGHRFRLLFGSFPFQWKTTPSEHLRFWTYRDMKWWLIQLGLEQKSKIVCYEGLSIFNKILPGLFSQGFVVIIKKR